MGVDVSAYIEKKKDDGSWELVTERALSSRLKYVIRDYNELPRLKWEDLSSGMQEKFKKDENGYTYANFYVTTLDNLEKTVSEKTRDAFIRIGMVVKALGAARVYNDDGEEMDWADGEDKEKLTFPINKYLVEEFQTSANDLREIGQLEAFDLFASEYVGYDGEYRIVLAVG